MQSELKIHFAQFGLSIVDGRTGSSLNLNILDQVRPSKKIIFLIFNYFLFEKLIFNIIQ
jgi:hypothetical protein